MRSMYVRLRNELFCTSNDIECLHCGLFKFSSNYYAHVWRFIERLQHDTTFFHFEITKVVLGAPHSEGTTYANTC